MRPSTDAVHSTTLGYNGTAIAEHDLIVTSGGMTGDTTIFVEAQCANSGDVVACYQFVVEPITQLLE